MSPVSVLLTNQLMVYDIANLLTLASIAFGIYGNVRKIHLWLFSAYLCSFIRRFKYLRNDLGLHVRNLPSRLKSSGHGNYRWAVTATIFNNETSKTSAALFQPFLYIRRDLLFRRTACQYCNNGNTVPFFVEGETSLNLPASWRKKRRGKKRLCEE